MTAAAPAHLPLNLRRGSRPTRMCVGCRQRGPAAELVRVVAWQGVLVIDNEGRAEGRGAHVHPLAECITAAKRGWARALKVSGPLDDTVVRGLVQPEPNREPTTKPFHHESAGESE